MILGGCQMCFGEVSSLKIPPLIFLAFFDTKVSVGMGSGGSAFILQQIRAKFGCRHGITAVRSSSTWCSPPAIPNNISSDNS